MNILCNDSHLDDDVNLTTINLILFLFVEQKKRLVIFFLQVKDVTRNNCKGVVAASLDEVKAKVAEKFGKTDIPNIHLDSDGTEIDDEDYFQTLEPNTELVAVFTGEQWIDVSKILYLFKHVILIKICAQGTPILI